MWSAFMASESYHYEHLHGRFHERSHTSSIKLSSLQLPINVALPPVKSMLLTVHQAFVCWPPTYHCRGCIRRIEASNCIELINPEESSLTQYLRTEKKVAHFKGEFFMGVPHWLMLTFSSGPFLRDRLQSTFRWKWIQIII